MQFSRFGDKFASHSGIGELMDDMGDALSQRGKGTQEPLMLGGGNPAHIGPVMEVWRQRMRELLDEPVRFDKMLADYDAPRGNAEFIQALAAFLRREYGWDVDERNIAITNGSQSTYFLLFNLLAGTHADGTRKKILFPLLPEYIGYADQSLGDEDFAACAPIVSALGARRFKYGIDRVAVKARLTSRVHEPIAAICVSRPTNPSGNVLTDDEIAWLAATAREHDIPLIVDNAYGQPFPGIIFADTKPLWNKDIVLSLSLSKLGLPSTRTGIVVARPEIVQAISSMNAIVSLANGSVGAALCTPLLHNGEIKRMSTDIIRPFYRDRSLMALDILDTELTKTGIDYAVHQSEGAIFHWLWLKNLPVDTKTLYTRLKKRGLLVIPGQYFFFGEEGEPHPALESHRRGCLRLSYAQEPETVRKGIALLADEIERVLGE